MPEPKDTWSAFCGTTKLLHSAMIAFDNEKTAARERQPDAELVWQDGQSRYRVYVSDHVQVLTKRGRELFFAQTLMQSWSHCERFARFVIEQRLSATTRTLRDKLLKMSGGLNSKTPASIVAEQVLLRAGALAWGRAVLDLCDRTWDDVFDGEGGFYATSLIRNALVHGQINATEDMIAKVSKAGGSLSWAVGQPIELDYQMLRRLRDRIRSFGRVVAPSHTAARK